MHPRPVAAASVSENLPTLAADPAMELTTAQRTAVELLSEGKTPTAAATAAGVSRRTVHRWIHADPAFRAAYHAWQKDAIDTARARLLALTDAAVTAVANALEKGDTKTAVILLKGLHILTRPAPGSTDPAALQQEADTAHLAEKTARDKAAAEAREEAEYGDIFGHDIMP